MSTMEKIQGLLLQVLTQLKVNVSDYCDLETVDGNSIVAQDGSMATIAKFHGIKSVLGREGFERIVDTLTESLSVYFQTKGHQLQVLFHRDLDARDMLIKNADAQRASADRLNLVIDDLIDENVEKYTQYLYEEECYFVFWSRPSLLDKDEMAMYQRSVGEFKATNKYPAMSNAQNLLRPISYLRDRHAAYVNKIVDSLSSPELACSIEILEIEDALRSIRHNCYPDYTSGKWNPIIPGIKKIPFRWKENDKTADMSEFSFPPLPTQIMVANAKLGANQDSVLPDDTFVRVGSRIYAPLVISVPPQEPQSFNSLFLALNRSETLEDGVPRALPYSLSIMLESDGLSIMTFKTIFTSLLGFSNVTNRNINLATAALREYVRDGGCVVKLRISAMTWAKEASELKLRKSKLWRGLEGWGGAKVVEHAGDPMLAFQSGSLGLSTQHIGAPCPAPLDEVVRLLPISRPASPFSEGSTIYRSLDGKALRYQRFSSEQTTWITLIAGKPGSGKSVLMNNNNVESCLMPGLVRLPYIGIIDIGVSSGGFIDLIKDALPKHLQHLAVYKRLQNSERDCINPLDTPLGMRSPLPKDREFIKTFLTIMVTPPERRGQAHENMSDFVGRIIDLAYLAVSDKREKSSPVQYKPGHNPKLDEAVSSIGYRVTPATTYWEIVDALFTQGMVYEAELAQRFAVPTLNVLAQVASSEEIANEYGSVLIDGRAIRDMFLLGIRESVSNFPVFSSHTRFDIGSARIVSLDLQDVAIIGSDSAYKQTALMYMIARQSFMKKVAFSAEDLPFFEPKYYHYYDKLIKEIVDEDKVLCMDEFHKTGGHAGLKLQVLTDGREARKWKLEIILASQLMEDFGDLTKIATAQFILDAGTTETRNWLRKNTGLTDVEEVALTTYVHGANQHGATFLARFNTKNATYSQLFTMTVGAKRLWALTTTAEDRKLRGLLYEAMPKQAARSLLAKHFPAGSCKKVVERMKNEQFKDAEFVDDSMIESVVERIASQLIQEYLSKSK